ncbi:hypothetical protein DL89DRAFT_282227 [Linderina pennispora]|uniref:Uncharacterized protein n=1 Tax=Linderina pennispora TaxID=61395 RepID=A0A1Y1WFI5_9FUNG|nr:uncharacterized protein DL89DRAFT_282227 [Linderina pennispora]ORX72078.1 hypothetical protein DL89DRAFT_282227 [Linderina pennispora]
MPPFFSVLAALAMASAAALGDTSLSRFHCIYADGLSNLYMEQIGSRSVLFKCIMGTKCYQIPNKYAGIQCAYPDDKAILSRSSVISAIDDNTNTSTQHDGDSSPVGTDQPSDSYSLSPASSPPHLVSLQVVLPTVTITVTDDSLSATILTISSLNPTCCWEPSTTEDTRASTCTTGPSSTPAPTPSPLSAPPPHDTAVIEVDRMAISSMTPVSLVSESESFLGPLGDRLAKIHRLTDILESVLPPKNIFAPLLSSIISRESASLESFGMSDSIDYERIPVIETKVIQITAPTAKNAHQSFDFPADTMPPLARMVVGSPRSAASRSLPPAAHSSAPPAASAKKNPTLSDLTQLPTKPPAPLPPLSLPPPPSSLATAQPESSAPRPSPSPTPAPPHPQNQSLSSSPTSAPAPAQAPLPASEPLPAPSTSIQYPAPETSPAILTQLSSPDPTSPQTLSDSSSQQLSSDLPQTVSPTDIFAPPFTNNSSGKPTSDPAESPGRFSVSNNYPINVSNIASAIANILKGQPALFAASHKENSERDVDADDSEKEDNDGGVNRGRRSKNTSNDSEPDEDADDDDDDDDNDNNDNDTTRQDDKDKTTTMDDNDDYEKDIEMPVADLPVHRHVNQKEEPINEAPSKSVSSSAHSRKPIRIDDPDIPD